MCFLLRLTLALASVSLIGALPEIINVEGIFGPGEERQELAFKYAIERINSEPTILPNKELRAQTITLRNDDSFTASITVCQQLGLRIAAIFGPSCMDTANYVQSLCDSLQIPHIETRWNYKLKKDPLSINLHPHPTHLGKAYFDIISELGWKKFVIFYDSNEGLARLQSLLQSDKWSVLVRHLQEGGDFRPILKEMKKNQETKFLLDLSFDKLYEVLQQAQQIGLMSDYHSYFITTMDLHMVNLDAFRFDGTNITSIRMVDPNSREVQTLVQDWMIGEMGSGRQHATDTFKMTTEAALMYDAVWLFAHSLQKLDNEMNIDVDPLYCESSKVWPHGSSVIRYMQYFIKPTSSYRGGNPYGMNLGIFGIPPMVDRPGHTKNEFVFPPINRNINMSDYLSRQLRGLTGSIKFNDEGWRTEFDLEIVELEDRNKYRKVAIWSLNKGVTYTRSSVEINDAIITKLQNRTIRVTTALAQPYTYLKDDYEEREGNDRFEGFCIDLIHEISLLLNFNYSIELVPDGSYGSLNSETGEWNGMVRELLDHRADVGIVDFTITTVRESAVDFSMPFMNLGISIVYKKPSKPVPNMLQFMAPFSVDVWIYIATAYLGVSVLLFILARMVPAEWDSPYPCIQDPDELENCFTLVNSLWFIMGTFLCQGGDIAPRAVSTRIVTSLWWFFTLIMIASYTANLAAFLTVSQMQAAITSAEDLAKQTKIKYGSKFGGSTYSFFKNSKIPTYQRMWNAMSNARPSVFPATNEEGIDRVSKADGAYAFLMESSSIEYVVERKCDLMQVGGLLDSKSYGIAFPPGSPYTSMFSQAILRVKERGIVMDLKKKWWNELKGGGACESEEEEDPISAAELGMDNVGGVFVVMGGGFAVSVFVACCEFLWKARKLTQYGDNWVEEVWKEIRFILNFTENTKPVRKKPSPAETDSSSIYSFSNSNYGYTSNKAS